jgi:hypothetical protein
MQKVSIPKVYLIYSFSGTSILLNGKIRWNSEMCVVHSNLHKKRIKNLHMHKIFLGNT